MSGDPFFGPEEIEPPPGESLGAAPTIPGMEAEGPPRSLNLSGFVWGVDPSTRTIAVGVVPPAGAEPFVRSLALEQADKGPGRLALAVESIRGFVVELAAEAPPTLVLVEQPFARGRNVHPQSFYVVGVLLASLRAGLGEVGVIDAISPPSWKKEGCGRGNLKPPEYLAWARESAGYSGSSEDEAAALGIASAAGVRLAGHDGRGGR